MRCKVCGADTYVKDSRDSAGRVRRKRVCEKCGASYYTVEVPEEDGWTPNLYQVEALRTASGMAQGDKHSGRLLNGVMGLCGEAGECIDLVKKHVFQGHDLDKEHLAKELGDVQWYLAVAADGIGYKLAQIMDMNVRKLRMRYPDGFDVERSTHRAANDV